jgi:CDP-2,3-bis-(O-geranylgeranyl)-sn-glycerol synthase
MIILEALFFILPAYISNGCASLSKFIPLLCNWNTPIDFGNEYRGKRILGDGKTFRGLFFGTFSGVLTGVLQYFIVQKVELKYLVDYNGASLTFFILVGLLLGFGALFGDLVKSLIKRRIGIKRGQPWPPFDQLDFIVGSILITSLLFFPGWKVALILFIITPAIHLLTNVIAYKLKLKDVWW